MSNALDKHMKPSILKSFACVSTIMLFAIVNIARADASPRKCTVNDEKSALKLLSTTKKTWRNLHKIQMKYVHCDDGSIGEGFSENIVLMLVKHWSSLDELVQISKKNPEFESFVLKHIDGTVNQVDLESIATLTQKQCKKATYALCKKMHSVAVIALREL